jgi:hypothetical protein
VSLGGAGAIRGAREVGHWLSGGFCGSGRRAVLGDVLDQPVHFEDLSPVCFADADRELADMDVLDLCAFRSGDRQRWWGIVPCMKCSRGTWHSTTTLTSEGARDIAPTRELEWHSPYGFLSRAVPRIPTGHAWRGVLEMPSLSSLTVNGRLDDMREAATRALRATGLLIAKAVGLFLAALKAANSAPGGTPAIPPERMPYQDIRDYRP